MSMLERALEIAREAHAGQVDKAGQPVIEHVLRVVDAVEGEDAKVVAALHDVLEDCHGSMADKLESDGFPFHALEAVAMLARPKWRVDTYAAYIGRLCRYGSPLARAVKIADLRDHLHPDRIGVLSPSHVERYRRALRRLGADTATSGAAGREEGGHDQG